MPRRRPFRRLYSRLSSAAPALGVLGRKSQPQLHGGGADAPLSARGPAGGSLDGAVQFAIDPLEQRLMMYLSTVSSGQAEFLQEGGGAIRVAWSDMSFELIGADVGTSGNTLGLPIDQATEHNLVAPSPVPPAVIPNLFAIYIMQSTLDSWMSIAAVAVPSATATERPMLPFGASSISVVDVGIPTSTTLITAPIGTNTGSALLGATHNGTNDANEPIITEANNGSVPGPFNPGATITAGLYMSPVAIDSTGAPILGTTGLDQPNDIGRFFFGGVITGNVNIPAPTPGTVPAEPASQGGNVGVFYAGSILTGDATGESGDDASTGPASSVATNFYVGGDVRDLVTAGGIGGGRGAATRIEQSQYITNFRGVIAGSLGELNMFSGGLFGSLDVEHLPSVYGVPDTLFSEHELEAVVEDDTAPGDYFGPSNNGLLATLPDINTGEQYPMLPSSVFANDTTPDTPTDATLGTPQYLGSIKETDADTGLPAVDTHGNILYEATVSGVLEAADPSPEAVDNYAIPLVGGQTIETLLDETVNTGERLSLIDPDGRVVATNESHTDGDAAVLSFSYTADRPGIYTFRVDDPPDVADYYYTLTVQGVGDLGLGTVAANAGDIYDTGLDSAYEVDNGDLGAIIAGPGSNFASSSTGPGTTDALGGETPPTSVYVPEGNVREVKAGSLGELIAAPSVSATGVGEAATFGLGPYLNVPRGEVGLVQATNAAGVLDVMTPFDEDATVDTSAEIDQSLTVPYIAIEGNIQTIDGAGVVYLDIATNAGIGEILAGNMSSNPASFIDVNADNSGSDGIIDLINVTGDLGTLANGGPGIVTHDGGYVRYMRVGGEIFQDEYFGSGLPVETVYGAGQTVTYTDDTGATLTFAPQGPTSTIVYNNGLTTTTTTYGPQISLTTYGIRDKGGGVIVDATAIGGSMTITSSGGSGADNGEADISLINFVGNSINTIATSTTEDGNDENELAVTAGTPYASNGTTLADGVTNFSGFDDTTTGLASTASQTVAGVTSSSTLTINGDGPVDVLQIIATAGAIPEPDIVTTTGADSSLITFGFTPVAASGNVDAIINNTAGEIGSILTTGSVGEIYSHGTLGLLSSTTGAAVVLSNTAANAAAAATGREEATGSGDDTEPTYAPTVGAFTDGAAFPFSLQTNGIMIGGNAIEIMANQGLGNIDVSFSVNSVVANESGQDTPGVFSGIEGPIVANNIFNAQIGDGIAGSGSGELSQAGLYATIDIGTVSNGNRSESDIRGNIVAEQKIDTITLGGGSIIGAQILSVTTLVQSEDDEAGFVIQEFAGSTTAKPIFGVGRISISGRGGIIGTLIEADNVGPITIGPAGFGMITSTIETLGAGVIGQLSIGGYGLRDSFIVGGALIQGINLTGNGSQLSAGAFGTDLRGEGINAYDPAGQGLSPYDNLDQALGTTIQAPLSGTATETGVLEDDVIRATTALDSLAAQTIRTIQPVTLLDEVEPAPNIPSPGEQFPMEIDVAGVIANVVVRGIIDGLQITTGSLNSFRPAGSVSRLGISVAGTIQSLIIHGNFGQRITDPATDTIIPDSYISATGLRGTIDNLVVYGDLNGNVTANNAIEKMMVTGNVLGNITALGQTSGLTLGTLRIGGTLSGGSLNIDGSAGTIITNGSLGAAGQSITIVGALHELMVGATARGSTLASAVHVEGPLGTLVVNGTITGALQVDGDLTTLRVNDSGAFANAIGAPVIVGGRLKTATIIGGNVDANVGANGSIGTFTIQRGSLAYGATVVSTLAAINSFRITGGTAFGLYGALQEADGVNTSINISGNFGDGTDPAGIVAYSGSQFIVGGSILADTVIDLTGGLNLLQVSGDIDAGAIVAASPLKKVVVHGNNAAGITAT
jgi:hypothetical protein